jgi:DNA-binding NtrC family response regulator
VAHLAQLDWPGNIRQLENAVYRAVVMSEGDQLDLADFPLLTPQPHLETDIPTAPLMLEPIAAPSVVSGGEIPIAPLPLAGTLSMLTPTGDVRPLDDMENEIIRFAISHYRGQMSEVARRLKIGRSTLYRKLDEAGVPGHGGKSGEETP